MDTDQLTGLGTKEAWDHATGTAASALRARDVVGYVVLSIEVEVPTDDQVQLVAATVRSSIRSTDVLCRVGKEEFRALLPDALETDVTEITARIADKLTTAKIGWAVYNGDWAATVKQARERAHAAGRGKVHVVAA
jgi:hypothetical protein